MRSLATFTIVLLATFTSASSVISTPLKRLQRTGAYLKGSPDADRARAAFLASRRPNGPITLPATNFAYIRYTATVGIGSPPTYYNLVIDTGSSNTFCGTGIRYVKTFTSLHWASYLDQVALAPNLVITGQSIGDALSFAGFDGIDGLIGVGPVDLTQGTLVSDMDAKIPTVLNNLASQGLIANQVLGVHFAPSTNYSDTNGALTYGGVDPSLYKGELTYAPTTNTYPASTYWGIDITSSIYHHKTIIPARTAGIVDTGTTQILLADDYFSVYLHAIPGAKLDSHTGLIEIPDSSVQLMHSLIFTIAGREFALDVAGQLIPADENTVWGGVAGKRYSVIGNLGRNSGMGLDFVLGQKFMERYYAVFDADANQVGFAETNFTFAYD